MTGHDDERRRPPKPQQQADGQPENANELEDPRGASAESERRSAERGETEKKPERGGGENVASD